jgi:hypothetical protein
MSKYIIVIAITVSLFSFGCKKNIDIVGEWQIDKEEFFVGGELINKVENTGARLHFFEDGKGADQDGIFQWEISKDSLFVFDYGEKYVYIITKSTANSLILEDRSYKKETKQGDVIVITLSR